VVNAHYEPAARGDGEEAFELGPDGLFTRAHHGLVEAAEEAHPGMIAAEAGDIDAGAPLERKDAVQAALLEPAERRRDIAVRVHDCEDPQRLQARNHPCVVRCEKLVEEGLR
jgi:hypothetical protein